MKKSVKLSFGEAALIYLKRKKMTVTDLAKALEVSQPYISMILYGNGINGRTGFCQRKKICEVLGMDYEEWKEAS